MLNFMRFKVLTLPLRNLCHQNFPKTIAQEVKDQLLPKDHADTFGNYGEISTQFEMAREDPEDAQEERRKKKADRRSPGVYVDMIKSHLENHQYKKAVNILEERMLKIDRVKPDSYIYDLLISYCGRKGDVSEAFRLYNQIKNRGYHVTGGQYTSLFNACANSGRSQYALEVAAKVRNFLSADELHKINIKNYNAMLKAFGRHGDLRTALTIVDEVLERRGKIRDDTFNFLLQACIADPNSGFRHALFTWHRMLQHKTDPSVFTFNLLLRAARDCNLGDPGQVQDLLNTIQKEAAGRFLRKLSVSRVPPILPPIDTIQSEGPLSGVSDSQLTTHSSSSGESQASCSAHYKVPMRTGTRSEDEAYSNASEKAEERSEIVEDSNGEELKEMEKELSLVSLRQELSMDLPNMIAIRPKTGSFERLASFKSAYHRLLLMGGVSGFLQVMDSIRIKPDMKTFTLLLEVIPSTEEAETDLMSIISAKGISYDTGFFNVLIKKRCFRFDYGGAKEVLGLMQSAGVKVDLITFGVLSLTCRTREDAEELINNVRDAGFRLNSQILAPLVRRATYIGDIQMGAMLLRAIKEDDVQPSPKLMTLLHTFVETHRVNMK